MVSCVIFNEHIATLCVAWPKEKKKGTSFKVLSAEEKLTKNTREPVSVEDCFVLVASHYVVSNRDTCFRKVPISYFIFAILQGIRGDPGSVGIDGDKGRTVSLIFSLLLSAVVSIL